MFSSRYKGSKDEVREESEVKVSLTSVLYHHAHVIDQVTFEIIDVTVLLFSILVTWLIRVYKASRRQVRGVVRDK